MNDQRRITRAFFQHTTFTLVIAMLALHESAPELSAQTARDVKGSTPLIALENEAPARLIVDPPIPEALAEGRAYIQYRAENARILPVFGKGALTVSPRLAHLHITVDDAPWHFVDASGETVILVGLTPGVHRVRFELADPTHRPITSQTVTFTVPTVAPR